MGINRTKEDRQNKANEHLALKLACEADFVNDLVEYYKNIAHDFSVVYLATENVLNLNESYLKELESLLKTNYRRISNAFLNDLLDDIDMPTDYENNEDERNKLLLLINFEIGKHILTRATSMSIKINDTNQNFIINSRDNYIVKQALEGLTAIKEDIASKVSDDITKFGDYHSEVVATTETQNISETTKNIEVQKITESILQDTAEKQIQKTWITFGDEKVRESHTELDGKTINNNEYFQTINGDKLMYSGDSSLGASLAEIINCRCSTIYSMVNGIMKQIQNTIFRKK